MTDEELTKKGAKVIGAVTIGKLIEGHVSCDERKFQSYAHFCIDAYREHGEERSARILENALNGKNKKEKQVVVLDNKE